MEKMKILCTLDGSSESEAIICPTAELAARTGASVKLLTVLTYEDVAMATRQGSLKPDAGKRPGAVFISRTSEPIPLPLEEAYEGRNQRLQSWRVHAIEYLSQVSQPFRDLGVHVELVAAMGDEPPRAIIEAAREDSVDLIAMSTHGRSGISAMVHGSVTEAVLSSGVAPVLLVRPKLS